MNATSQLCEPPKLEVEVKANKIVALRVNC